jgi:hypothetical protein
VQIIDGDKLKEWLYTNQSDYYDVINDRTYIRDHIDEIGCDLDKIELNDNEWLVVRYIKSYMPLNELDTIIKKLQHDVSNKTIAIPSSMDIGNYTTKELEKYVEWLNKEIKQRKE